MTWQTPGVVGGVSPDQVLAQEAQRTFMAKVYRWMFGGLLLTAGVSMYTASSVELMEIVRSNFFLIFGLELVAVMAFSFLASRVSGVVAGALFLAYAFLNGLTFSAIFLRYQLGSVGVVFGVTALMFGAMAAYGTFTKKDLSGWSTFLFMGLFGIVIASVANLFIGSGMLSFVVACAGVLVFAGLAAYDNQKLREMHAAEGYPMGGTLHIRGALTLYLDFVNLFIMLLQLFGRRR